MKWRHGYCGTREYQSWNDMKKRCFNPNNIHYRRYGARGITVCERWLDFKNFIVDMGPCPVGLTLDRIDNDGNYTPENCRWATRSLQSKNRNQYRFGTAKGYSLDARRGLYRAFVTTKQKYKHIGYFNSADAARSAYLEYVKNEH